MMKHIASNGAILEKHGSFSLEKPFAELSISRIDLALEVNISPEFITKLLPHSGTLV